MKKNWTYIVKMNVCELLCIISVYVHGEFNLHREMLVHIWKSDFHPYKGIC